MHCIVKLLNKSFQSAPMLATINEKADLERQLAALRALEEPQVEELYPRALSEMSYFAMQMMRICGPILMTTPDKGSQ